MCVHTHTRTHAHMHKCTHMHTHAQTHTRGNIIQPQKERDLAIFDNTDKFGWY